MTPATALTRSHTLIASRRAHLPSAPGDAGRSTVSPTGQHPDTRHPDDRGSLGPQWVADRIAEAKGA